MHRNRKFSIHAPLRRFVDMTGFALPPAKVKSLETSVFQGFLSMAGVEGLEPSKTVLETGMLPLHYTPK